MKIFKGLQNLWSFDNSLKDSVGRCDLTIQSNVAPSPDRFGNASSAFFFNNGYATLPSGVYFDPSSGGATIMVWFKAVSINSWQRIVEFGTDTPERINLANHGTNPKLFSMLPGGLQTISVSSVKLNIWVHLTVTFTTTSSKFYFNGSVDATVTGIILKMEERLL